VRALHALLKLQLNDKDKQGTCLASKSVSNRQVSKRHTDDGNRRRNNVASEAFAKKMKAKLPRPAQLTPRRVVPIGLAFVFLLGSAHVQGQDNSLVPSPTVRDRCKISLPAPPDFAENGRAIAGFASGPGASVPESDSAKLNSQQFRIERIEVKNGAELLTIFGRVEDTGKHAGGSPEVPLISVLRDTLGDNDPENDRLRYVWMLTYAQPSLRKRVAAAVPFFYQHVGNQTEVAAHPSPIIDLANARRETWNRFFWFGVQNIFLDTYGLPLKASSRNYRRNLADYRNAHVMEALSILSNYENIRRRTRDENELLASSQTIRRLDGSNSTEPIGDSIVPLLKPPTEGFTPGEMIELRGRLIFSNQTFGGLASTDILRSTVEKRATKTIDLRDHNWEMLRQRAEAEGLYFEPLLMPDGSATHALLWAARSDLAPQANRHFNGRFLNIADPWHDARLRDWKGYTETRYFDADNHLLGSNDPNARPVEMIPLALYGLDHPKVPAVLIDFRDQLNPKKREVSRRVFHDIAKNILSLSSFGNIPYFLGKSTYDFITGQRGMDVNQPSRLQSYAELKLLLLFNGTIDPKLRREIEQRLEVVSLNPLSNSTEAELQLARKQYDALLKYALDANGLPARIQRDRATEMIPLKHGRTSRALFTVPNVLSFGRYVHRETVTGELTSQLELARRIRHHSEFLQQVAKSSPQIDVVWDLNLVRNSLQLLATHGETANGGAARAAAAIFDRTADDETRRLCLDTLYKIKDKTAKNELLRLYRDPESSSAWKALIADRLRKAVTEDARMKPAQVKAVLSELGQP
jgi:hypothetical protein